MIRFECDYLEGAHPQILKKMAETNLEQTAGYGNDPYCDSAKEKIRKLCGEADVDIHFLVGGTQTNCTVISAVLRPYQGVLAAVTGHINVHETGAIEASGHKVLALPSEDGKITADQVRESYEAHWNDADHEHIVQPGMVYISQPTENGTLYSKEELQDLHDTCKELELPLFMDGARMGYGLMSKINTLTLEDIAALTDVFYIGGTKVGALFGEAVVISHPALKKDFRYLIKQHGGMLAKGRLLGIQFDTLFTDGLYFEIAKYADDLAMRLKEVFVKKGYPLRFDSYTNQQFPILPNEHIEQLRKKYSFAFWETVDDSHSAVRFCTSWATKEEAVSELIRDIEVI
ncbi:threonine aldolase family protein [Bariatricus sp. SGI.154]|uniref:threonine aldolase family protein n=1 Tax=Bariatricus sp. SGI.154 TaxID=3420549 RepID=UPI003CFE3DE0